MTAWLNVKVMIANSGNWGGKYADFIDFTKCELMSHFVKLVKSAYLPFRFTALAITAFKFSHAVLSSMVKALG